MLRCSTRGCAAPRRPGGRADPDERARAQAAAGPGRRGRGGRRADVRRARHHQARGRAARRGGATGRALWGADWCRFSVGGSTHGNQALALAVGAPGQEVVVTRTLHRSLLLGLVLAGLRPVWVRPEMDRRRACRRRSRCEAVRAALADHPDAARVFLGDPSYVGTIGDLAGQADAAHEAGVPLVVDAAWAAHFGFHPDLPPHALAAGADAMVTSAHKALPAYTQGALVLARTEPARRRPAGPGVRGHPHHQPGRVDHGQHRRRAGAAGARRRGAVRPAAAAVATAQATAARRCPVSTSSTVRAWSRPSWSCCWPGPGRTGTRSRRT